MSLDDRLTRLRFRNFLGFADTDVELDNLVVLVGPNSAGKSNIVEGLRFLRDALGGLDKAIVDRGGIGQLRRMVAHPGKPRDMEIGADAIVSDAIFSYGVTIGAASGGGWRLKRETCRTVSGDEVSEFVREGSSVKFLGGTRHERAPAFDDALTLPLAGPEYRPLASFLRRGGAYNIYPETLRRPQRLVRAPRLDDGGENLASILRRLRKGRSLAPIREALADIVPQVSDLRVTEPGGFLAISAALGHEGKQWFDAERLSDGTLRLLGILTAIYQRPAPSLVVIEEPELNVHPGAAGIIADELIDAAQRMQVIVTTHSPDIVSRMPIEALRVVEATSEGTKVGMVRSDEVDLVNEKLFSPGDLIRIGGLRRELHPTT